MQGQGWVENLGTETIAGGLPGSGVAEQEGISAWHDAGSSLARTAAFLAQHAAPSLAHCPCLGVEQGLPLYTFGSSSTHRSSSYPRRCSSWTDELNTP